MKRIYFFVSLFLSLFTLAATAQVKIGYTAASLILPELPEYQQKQKEIEAYIGQLQEQVTEKENEIRQKIKAFEEKRSTWLPVVVQQKQAEIQRLQQELEQMQKGFREDLVRYEETAMQPLFEQIQEKINQVAVEENFDFILNAYDGTGTSLLLAAPEADEITDRVLKKLGVTPKPKTGE
ncbi:MAG: OmpH family outer membrane protein [Bernardetiaceae bacterium]